MAKTVMAVPGDPRELRKATTAASADIQRTLGRSAGVEALDHANVARDVAERAGRIERANHRAILRARTTPTRVSRRRVVVIAWIKP